MDRQIRHEEQLFSPSNPILSTPPSLFFCYFIPLTLGSPPPAVSLLTPPLTKAGWSGSDRSLVTATVSRRKWREGK